MRINKHFECIFCSNIPVFYSNSKWWIYADTSFGSECLLSGSTGNVAICEILYTKAIICHIVCTNTRTEELLV